MSEATQMSKGASIPILPLRDVVVYPHMVIPLFVGREKSILALEAAVATPSRQILLIAQREATQDNPEAEDIYEVGTLSNILQLLKLPDGTVKVLVEGMKRGRVIKLDQTEPYFMGAIEPMDTASLNEREAEVLLRSVIEQFDQYVKLTKKVPPEIMASFTGIGDLGRLVDTIAAYMSLKISEKQRVLEIPDLRARIEHLMGIVEAEIDLLHVEKRIRSQVERRMKNSQREYYLNEQLKVIQKELGDLGEETLNEIDELTRKIEKSGMPKSAKERAKTELAKLKMMAPMSAEATVCRNYIDWLLNVPWRKRSRIQKNLAKAERSLNKDHYGLDRVKERILENLAVQLRVKTPSGPILCLVGPPGVGKTSLGESIARATHRKYVKMSLGGVRDEAEIRGHRRTYIGAMPGKVLQKLAKAQVNDPLFLLDEIDKMANDFRGDPASALLEVLDPAQNKNFNDHYLEEDFDLSNVLFIATANYENQIPAPLLDRMEIIRLSGYTESEKLNIAVTHLLPKQLEKNGVKKEELQIEVAAIIDIIRYYTREAGVRKLEQQLSKICRKVVKAAHLVPTSDTVQINVTNLEHYLGVRKYRFGIAEDRDQVGQVTGLAWTEVGGEILTIEAMSMPGKGKVTSTGKLGEVMQESIQAAMTVVRSRQTSLGIEADFYEKLDIHVHVPEGAIPKDGPSAGIGMAVALVSTLTGIPVRKNVAMTGEITLRGQVLPIGGLKEKLLAARRAGITDVIIPEENQRDLKEVPQEILEDLQIHAVRWIDEVLSIALTSLPQASGQSGKDKVIHREGPLSEDLLHH